MLEDDADATRARATNETIREGKNKKRVTPSYFLRDMNLFRPEDQRETPAVSEKCHPRTQRLFILTTSRRNGGSSQITRHNYCNTNHEAGDT